MEAILRGFRKMSVPRMSQIKSGVGVNIVLKADQRTGKLTTGQVADILTRGDHPRGIKVRLSSGHIGRVQSLSSGPSPTPAVTAPAVPSSAISDFETGDSQSVRPPPQMKGNGREKTTFAMQDDYRNDPTPQNSTSLEHYIKPSRKPRNQKAACKTEEKSVQTRLESEFPKLDSTLIAAILVDYEDPDEARRVLRSLP